MATSPILNDMQRDISGNEQFSMWEAVFILAGTAAISASSGKPYAEMAAYLASALGDHPVAKRYRTDFATQLREESQR